MAQPEHDGRLPKTPGEQADADGDFHRGGQVAAGQHDRTKPLGKPGQKRPDQPRIELVNEAPVDLVDAAPEISAGDDDSASIEDRFRSVLGRLGVPPGKAS